MSKKYLAFIMLGMCAIQAAAEQSEQASTSPQNNAQAHLLACGASCAASFVCNALLFESAYQLNPTGSYAAVPLLLGAICSPWILKKVYTTLYPERKVHTLEVHFGDYIGTIGAAVMVRRHGTWLNKALGGLLLQKLTYIMWHARNLPAVNSNSPTYWAGYEDRLDPYYQEKSSSRNNA